MTGYGTGIAHLVSARGQSGQVLLDQAAAARAQESAAHQGAHSGS